MLTNSAWCCIIRLKQNLTDDFLRGISLQRVTYFAWSQGWASFVWITTPRLLITATLSTFRANSSLPSWFIAHANYLQKVIISSQSGRAQFVSLWKHLVLNVADNQALICSMYLEIFSNFNRANFRIIRRRDKFLKANYLGKIVYLRSWQYEIYKRFHSS